jgi:hypothetical protein
MYLGIKQMGQEVTFFCRALDASRMASDPTLAPGISVRGSSGPIIFQDRMWKVDFQQDGLFQYRVLLDSNFTEGWYQARYSYVISGSPFLDYDVFYVNALGDDSGTVISMYYWAPPHASYVVRQQANNSLVFPRGPRIPS